MRVVIVGDSHAGALRKACKDDSAVRAMLGPDAEVLPIANGNEFGYRFFSNRADELRFDIRSPDKPWRAKPPSLEEDDVCFGFCFGFYAGHFLLSDAWTNFTLWNHWTPGCGRSSLSEAAFQQALSDYQWHALRFLSLAKGRGLRFAVIAAPPLQRLHKGVTSLGEEQASEMASALRGRMGAKLDAMGIPWVRSAPEAVGSDGFLLPKFRVPREDDYVHASPEYGKLMIASFMELTKRHGWT